MENLTLNEMNAVYMALVNSFGDQLITRQDNLKLIITLNSDCNTNDNTALVIDQKAMSIYETDGCCEECRCKSAIQKLLPVVETVLANHRHVV